MVVRSQDSRAPTPAASGTSGRMRKLSESQRPVYNGETHLDCYPDLPWREDEIDGW